LKSRLKLLLLKKPLSPVWKPPLALFLRDNFEAVLEQVTLPPLRQVTDLRFIDSLTDLVEQAKPGSVFGRKFALDLLLPDVLMRQSVLPFKRVNNLLVKGGYPPVNHSVIEATIERGYLAVVPDLTGTAEMTEYQLSEAGP
jgi:hypothetical protein